MHIFTTVKLNVTRTVVTLSSQSYNKSITTLMKICRIVKKAPGLKPL